MAAFENFQNIDRNFLPRGNAHFTRTFDAHTPEQTWAQLNNDYYQQVTNAKGLTSGRTEEVLAKLENYMEIKHQEEYAVVKFIFDHLNNEYIETFGNPNVKFEDIKTRNEFRCVRTVVAKSTNASVLLCTTTTTTTSPTPTPPPPTTITLPTTTTTTLSTTTTMRPRTQAKNNNNSRQQK